ncbi:MAG TPA: lysine--tRNA ligase [Acetivibrio sp.]|uniref:lysine--tRNA ligase n=1 Tax=Acetivibrio sp. TaxID=1872092 RepID=UPI002C07729D|nr:lysine--tRNA ligase [Acetivibrio sp.]HOM02136.1 lysine--tRNA ligase [Acetivibrio sp.]
MHWSDEIANKLISLHPDKEEFVLAAGTSPSGTVHIGNFRDAVTVYFVAKALRKQGKKTVLLLSWDDYDRFRKVPKNLPEDRIKEYESYIGMPYSAVPDPFGCHASYAEHYEKEYEESLEKIGLKFDIIRYQTKEYMSGRYKDGIITALKNRKEIYDIMQEFKTQEYSEEERENFYPVSVYCDKCGKDTTKITELSEDCNVVGYSCKCGNVSTVNISEQGNCKLPWKVDWPMRWMYEGVDFEPGGKDHASPQGSYQVSRVIAKKIYNIDEPLFQGYEFIGIKGLTGKMSGSSGLNINLEELLKIYPPEIIWWLYAKKTPNEAFDISLGDDVPRIYGEFDRIYENYYNNAESLDEITKSTLDIVLDGSPKKVNPPFNILLTLYSISNGKIDMIEEMFTKIGMSFKAEELKERLEKVAYWLEKYAPNMLMKLNTSPDFEYFEALDDEVKGWVKDFCELIKIKMDSEELTTRLYAIPKKETADVKENKKNQLLFFKTMYRLLIGEDKGPMLSTLILAVGAENILPIVEPLVKGGANN